MFVDSDGFYEYINGVWTRQPRAVIKGYVDRTYGEFSTAQRINAVTNILEVRGHRKISFNTQPVWNFINGTLELDTGKFRDHDPNDFCSFQAKYPYDPHAACPAWERFIQDVTGGDPKTMELLQFIPGYVFFPDCSMEKIFVLTGSGGNGKSKYLEVLRQLFGAENCTHITPRGLVDKFQRINLKNSLVNLAGEIKSDVRDAEEYMKQVASGETISACFKSQDFIHFNPRTKLVFACNGQLASGDTSEGLERRLVIIDFKMRFVDIPDPNDPYQRQKNINILDDITTELLSGGIFNWAYAGYKLLRAVGYFTETNDQIELLSDFKRASNPVLVFWEDEYSDSRPAEIEYNQIFEDYKAWCVKTSEPAISSQKFHLELKNIFKGSYETVTKSLRIDGKPRKQRYYVLQRLQVDYTSDYSRNP
jgi:putative DNA primase/helicase